MELLKAYSAEATIDFANKERAAVNQQKKDFGKYKQQLKVKEFSNKGKQAQSSQTPRPCPECGKFHSGECMKGKWVCYYCKQPGHMKNECPKWKSLGGVEGTTVSKGRVYTIDGGKTTGDNSLIA
ncbi:retrotransposon protein, partial [Trifolium medium]|nr:retrotransposon protein [Trifolium medium]